MKRKIVGFVFVVLFLLAFVVISISMTPTKKMSGIEIQSSAKPVILLTVDSLMSEPLKEAVNDGSAPALSFLIRNGRYIPDMISSYPTMSVAIDSTILTGTYPDQHKIPGLIWFSQQGNRMISYGSGMREIWNNGVKNVARDSIVRLNNDHLSSGVKTIYEELEEAQIPSASINGLIFRGNEPHQLNVPKMLSVVQLLPSEIKVSGPRIMSLGALSQYNPDNNKHKFIWNRLGVNNDFTINELKYLIDHNKLPPFTLAYLPDLDAKVHRKGTEEGSEIEKLDQSIQELFNLFDSWEEAVEKVTWIVMGDSAQSVIQKDKDKGLIDLNQTLKDYSFWSGDNREGQLAIAINERMAYINLNDETININSIIEKLKTDKRIGLIAWKDKDINYVINPERETILSFSKEGQSQDIYNQNWDLDGDLSILDLSLSTDGLLQYDAYPDGLARLYGALNSHEGDFVIVDAKPSFEFIEEHSHDHAGGGAHGSLHKIDSTVPLIFTGTNTQPKYNRLVDIKEWIMGIVR
ncbi:alkaline phosphatase family protein [Ureibacillus aquaedulcis]|uniref:Alkaline phosphatase family protein n=1 Tax=Ureibacillus aquaedulcis TaxID=3058421 RepID=A0ABT8GPZ2_9BACL|nr:alkaline phosphatase family protein [Ureibacillus sp. BA0131]MDN4493482.1 alkaline phosphatase family protein [Ureibacillus sp. BA0131]